MPRRRVLQSAAPVIAVLSLGLSVLSVATDGFQAVTEEGARRLRIAREAPAVTALSLEDMHGRGIVLGGRVANDTSGSGRSVDLVEFIYTTCPTVCQAAGSDYARLRDKLVEAGLAGSVRLLSVSFDPANDDGPAMRDYAGRHGANGVVWTVARLRADDLIRVQDEYGLRVIPDQWGGFQHNAAVHLVNHQGRLSGIFDINDVDGIFNAVAAKQ